ncbi:restriction endonuclease subunit S, partial [Methanobrevibacter sp.]
YEEQEKIANFLTLVDKKIEMLDIKYNVYLNFKKYLMQQIFAQKLRFENDYSWKESTLGSIGKTYNGLSGLSKDNFEGGNSKYVTYKSIFDNNLLREDLTENVELNNKSQNIVKKGDLFFTGSSETPEEVGMVSVLTFDIPNCYLNSFCFGYRLNDTNIINPLYLAYYLRSPIMRNKIQILAQGSTRFNLSKKEILKLKIEIPNIDEQLKILNFMQNTDKLIESISNQIREINLFKKSLLQQMFVFLRIFFLISVRKSVASNIF